MATRRTILLSCGEASGERYAAAVAEALRVLDPELRLVGVGGDTLAAAGVEVWAHRSELEVMGFLEVVRHLPRLRRLGGALERRARDEGVDLFLPVDYPGFHISLAGRLRRHGIRVLDLIPPKTWSWGAWRLRTLRRNVDRCAVIFPFEEGYYRDRGVDATFVGHPLAAAPVSPDGDRDGLLVVPGSRRQELLRIGATLGTAARRLRERGHTSRVRVSRAPGVEEAWLAGLLTAAGECEVVQGPLEPWLRRAEVALVTSGTASLETALAGTPHVVVYRTSPVTYALARLMATVDHIGMANIVLGRRAFPELLQGDLTADALTGLAAPLFGGETAEAQRVACVELRALLTGEGWGERVAGLALELLDARVAPS